MKRAVLLAVVAVLALVSSASAATVRLHATQTVRGWASHARFHRGDFLVTELRVKGRQVPATAAEGCRVNYIGAGVAVHVNSCGAHIHLRYVTFGPPVEIRFGWELLTEANSEPEEVR